MGIYMWKILAARYKRSHAARLPDVAEFYKQKPFAGRGRREVGSER